MTLTVFVPEKGCSLSDQIDAGSGVVGTDLQDGQVRIDYEGNRHGSPELRRYADRVHLAAVRHTWDGGEGYPTRARATVDNDSLVRVGTYDMPSGTVKVEDEDTVRTWLGLDRLPPEELTISSGTEID